MICSVNKRELESNFLNTILFKDIEISKDLEFNLKQIILYIKYFIQKDKPNTISYIV